jgi:hypothetical protein
MACKYLRMEPRRKPPETGDSALPVFIKMPACQLGREPLNRLFWAGKCEETPQQGPCWRWEEEHPGAPDPQF